MRKTVLAWGSSGICAGLVVSVIAIRVNDSIDAAQDVRALLVWMTLIYGAAILGLGLLSLVVSALEVLSGRVAPAAPSRATEFAAILLALMILGGGFFVTSALDTGSPRSLARLLVVFSAILAAGMTRNRPSARVARVGSLTAAASVIVAVACLGYAAIRMRADGAPGASPAHQVEGDRSARVVLIGLDGADWQRIHALIAEGRLPSLARLLESGVSGDLRTIQPTWSPIIWNTIATGRGADGHGVHDFSETRVPGFDCGIQRLRKQAQVPGHVGLSQLLDRLFSRGVLHEIPVTSCQRRSKAVWNVLSDHERRVAVLNWFASWPSEPLSGYVVSDNNPHRAAFLASRHGAVGSSVVGVTYPEALLGELSDLSVPEVGSRADEILALDFFDEIDRSAPEFRDDEALLGIFRFIYQSDAFNAAAAEYLLGREALDFVAIYLSGIDNVSHRFGRWPGVVDRYYAYVDGLVARVVDRAGERAHIVIVSDHGWEYEDEVAFGHDHAPDGVVILSGPKLRRGHALAASPSVFDIAPTLLALFGFPDSDEMQGAPIREAFLPALAASLPVESVFYGHHTPPSIADMSDAAGADELQQETIDKLRALGYVQ